MEGLVYKWNKKKAALRRARLKTHPLPAYLMQLILILFWVFAVLGGGKGILPKLAFFRFPPRR
jgi:hypothetical protein